MRFCIVTPVFRAAPWIRRCLRSIQAQTIDFRCIVRDDQSDDGTYELARDHVAGDARFVVERSESRMYALGNMVAGIRKIAHDPEDVVVSVDGDDWLRHRHVLERLREVYASPDVWMTYGSHQRWKNKLLHRIGWKVRRGIAAPYPPDVVARRGYRGHKYLASHLRTFKRFLFDAIDDADMRDENGRYFATACDVVHMIPMLEMAGPDHVRYLDELLYVYNNSNPINEHRVARDQQLSVEAIVAGRAPYAPLSGRPHG